MEVAGGLRSLTPVVPAAIAIREDLVDDARGKPLRLDLARAIDRELEGGGLPLAEHALATGVAIARAIAQHPAVRALDHEGVPHDRRALAREFARETQVVALGLARHGNEGLTLAVNPRAQRHMRAGVSTDGEAKRDGAARGGGTERNPIAAVTAVVICPHVSIPSVLRSPGAPQAAGSTGSASCCKESPRDGGHGRHPDTGWRHGASRNRPPWHCA